MPQNERNGKRKTREQFVQRRIPQLGYYVIVTDTKETEQNYFLGLRNSIPEELQGKIVIKVSKVKTEDLIKEALSVAAQQPQYGEPWVIFDRDQVQDFDQIIRAAESHHIKVGWSNPCIEAWFSTYFGTMQVYHNSVSCCKKFALKFEQVVKQKYNKSDDRIYEKLYLYGDEKQAIKIAQQKCDEHLRNLIYQPSDMIPCTTVHILVGEIKAKTVL